jgi:hypothetical protein
MAQVSMLVRSRFRGKPDLTGSRPFRRRNGLQGGLTGSATRQKGEDNHETLCPIIDRIKRQRRFVAPEPR